MKKILSQAIDEQISNKNNRKNIYDTNENMQDFVRKAGAK